MRVVYVGSNDGFWRIVTAAVLLVSAQAASAGQLANTGQGEVGQRQSRAQAAPNVSPLGRIQTRLQNRVQSRLRNRVDRFYSRETSATSPFAIASDQVERPTQSIPR